MELRTLTGAGRAIPNAVSPNRSDCGRQNNRPSCWAPRAMTTQ